MGLALVTEAEVWGAWVKSSLAALCIGVPDLQSPCAYAFVGSCAGGQGSCATLADWSQGREGRACMGLAYNHSLCS